MFATLNRKSPARPIRVLVAKPGLDGHDRGAKVVAAAFPRCRHGSDLHQAAPDSRDDRKRGDSEDVDVVGSRFSGAHMTFSPGPQAAR
jgi:methylmalonyl-CoA mutase C-terminal domain/subunit